MSTPRVFLVRHGETEWSLNGRHTGKTDIPLTPNGEKRVKATGRALVGNDRLIVPRKLAHIYVSPRTRAQRTFELLNLGLREPLPWKAHGPPAASPGLTCDARIEVTEDIREWDYGSYEGVTSAAIREGRWRTDLDPNWDIWRDGCPEGESPEQITQRVDRLINEIRDKWHRPVMGKKDKGEGGSGDVLIVAHGHILRAFAQRWVGKSLRDGVAFLLEAGGVGTLSYEHHSINEPAILLGGAFFVDIVEQEEKKPHEV
ncbi:Sedoheptulose 1,7-bisphosphatase [Diplogelasinospora grovesii]|uniref:Sedoheptulose 1,7-bisphosphatase n=1 Tax=Diplogelasinospora grovesii TaxID=303347 RepID=A0AAN6NDW3_9PEZI|nr:Sedoheptulose 1,7-bisphosphatase [Diplogelasinospora grovesii]